MEECPSYSHKSREKQQTADKQPDKKVTAPIVTGAAKPKKKGEIQKITDVFISEDAANVKSYILMDVLVPAIKKAISDIVTNGIDMVLYGETGRSRKSSTGSKISYRNYYERERDRDRGSRTAGSRSGFDYDNIIFDNRGDADAVLTEMDNILDEYKFVSVGDLYDLADVQTTNYRVHSYGWISLASAKVVRVADGYMLKLPRAVPRD